MRNFQAEYAFRDSGNLVKVVTRPGVFSHRELDLGAVTPLDLARLGVLGDLRNPLGEPPIDAGHHELLLTRG